MEFRLFCQILSAGDTFAAILSLGKLTLSMVTGNKLADNTGGGLQRAAPVQKLSHTCSANNHTYALKKEAQIGPMGPKKVPKRLKITKWAPNGPQINGTHLFGPILLFGAYLGSIWGPVGTILDDCF